MSSASARALFSSLVDYAGLFPPAALPMDAAVAEYRRCRTSPEAWMLGRFVVPAVRLAELAAILEPGGDAPWGLSALLGSDLPADLDRVQAFNAGQRGRACVDTVELKTATPDEVKAALEAVPPALVAYVELPVGEPGQVSPADVDHGLSVALALLHARGGRAKVRTGGVVAAAVPSVATLAGFLSASALALAPFKATAGLHHAVRGEYPLTYEAQAPRAVLHGFLNLVAAAAIARSGALPGELETVLEERDPRAFRLDDDGLGWRDRRVPTPQVARCRASFALAFGSCSFAEPVDELRALDLVP
ncbi:MAG TPA: hypothetical protein VEQ10_21550 [Vicinamibacteria bacterium]|nr:hypothetical protein [Vicinamibacteria bacterium]